MDISEELIDGLAKIGLSTNQVKVYIANLIIGEATAYVLAKEAGVPRAKVYEVLDSLVDLGFIVKTPTEKGTLFTALSSEITIDKSVQELVSTIANVKERIDDLQESHVAKISEPPVMVINNSDVLLEMVKNGSFTEAWIDSRMEFAQKLRLILSNQDCFLHSISSTTPLMLIIGPEEAFYARGRNGSRLIIKFSRGILQQILELNKTSEIDSDSIGTKKPSVRIISETTIIDLEDRIKTIIPGFDWKTESILFWGKMESVQGAFDVDIPCDCIITENRLLFGSDDGKVWARAVKFIIKTVHRKGSITIIFQKIGGTEEITIKSLSYSKIIDNIIKLLHK
ncbi:MAG: hypothetical protein FK734_06905 [Asgard group archaeon]|nr:hypothetical protein [Asgard group archaeon]